MGQARGREGFQMWDRRGVLDVGQARDFRRGTGEGFKTWDRRLMSHVGQTWDILLVKTWDMSGILDVGFQTF